MKNNNNQLTQPEDFSFLFYLGGLFDGEGYFVVEIFKHVSSAFNFQIRPVIGIDLVEQDGEQILKLLQNTLSVGKLIKKHPKGNRRKTLRWKIQKFFEVKKFSNIILPYLFIKKSTCQKFLYICSLFESGRHFSLDGFLKICKLRDELNQRSKSPYYRNYSWFKNYFRENPINDNQLKIASEHRNHTINHKGKMRNVTKKELEKLYYNDKLGLKQIAEKYGVSYFTVRYHMIQFGIPRRPKGKNLKYY